MSQLDSSKPVVQYSHEAAGPVLVIPPPTFPRPKRGGLGGPPPKLERKPNPGNGKQTDYFL